MVSGHIQCGIAAALILVAAPTATAYAQANANSPAYQPVAPVAPVAAAVVTDYIVGPQDVLNITAPDDPTLTGRYTVEADHTFTYPLLGRIRAGGRTLREVEMELQQQLVNGGFLKEPQILVSIEQYKSQKFFVVGEVRTPGAYSMSGSMRLVEALALAGSTLPTAAGEAVVVPVQGEAVRVNLRDLQNGALNQNIVLNDGDTVFVRKAENIYVFGQVRNPGAYPLQQDVTTVLQGLALAGGVTDRGATSRVEIVRTVDGAQKKIKVKLDAPLQAGDTIVVPERFF
jgi:polysaccharide export outer membrane protein